MPTSDPVLARTDAPPGAVTDGTGRGSPVAVTDPPGVPAAAGAPDTANLPASLPDTLPDTLPATLPASLPTDGADPTLPSRLHRLAAVLRTHRVAVVVVLLAAGVRVVVTLAYRPVLLYSDSVDFLKQSDILHPTAWHPMGYPLVIAALAWAHNLTVYAVLNHAMGLAMGVLLYALLVRLGVRRWLAVLAVVPVLFDAYQLITEQYLLSDTTYQFLIVMAVVVMMWRGPDHRWRRPGAWRCLAVGLLFTAAAITRFDGTVIIVPALAFLIVRRVGMWRLAVVVMAFVLPIVAYAGWYDAVNGQFTTSGLTGLFLYARLAPFADCTGLTLPAYEQRLCPTQPVADRPTVGWWSSSHQSPGESETGHDGRTANQVLLDFDERIILHQPVQYASAVLHDYFFQFSPTHASGREVPDTSPWRFATRAPGSNYVPDARSWTERFGSQVPSVNAGLARLLADYQVVVYTPGPLLAALLGVSLVAVCWRRRTRGSGLRAETAALAGGAVLTMLFATATAGFDWRYQLPSLVLLPVAGALAVTMLVWPGPTRPRYRHSVGRSGGRAPEDTTLSPVPAPAPD